MRLKHFVKLVLTGFAFVIATRFVFAEEELTLSLSKEQLQRIGEKIYLNETGGNDEHLVAWNQGEAFASLGIGHFIWFPADLESPFTESFPSLLAFLQRSGIDLPLGLTPHTDAYWQSKADFDGAKRRKHTQSLKAFLKSTSGLQVQFIVQRLEKALPSMLEVEPIDDEKIRISQSFHRLLKTELGVYALIDYVNFKGEGTSLTERYNDLGWGLLQVLKKMPDDPQNIHHAFSQSCKQVLTFRVDNSPQPDVEIRWLKGWLKRCDTYQQPLN
ncbi:hypothetical protein J3L16_02630 [Alteromonas sp. 5E99-2]|uniref:hypothetical protein n=1 Tax=Alteromonas sp. 5E99-2 TaxID=2817683 RepID=UPI001A9873D8|nr:hypothetical protein [Alteromonas sp. 5E99-2]MBO1254580.1 hypothetical protein [Alteromonas sp. 5E99-2]